MKFFKNIFRAFAIFGFSNAVSAQDIEYDIQHYNMDGSMYCSQDEGDGSFTIYNDNQAVIEVIGANFTGYESAERVDGRPLNGYAVINYPNIFNDHAGIEIWEKDNVWVSPDFQEILKGNDVRIVLDFDDARDDDVVAREGAHCRMMVTSPDNKRHTVYFMPLTSPFIN